MKNIKATTLAINDILLNCIESMAKDNYIPRSEVIRKAVDYYIEKNKKLKETLSDSNLRFRSDKKYFKNGLLSIITAGLNINQISEINNLIPGFTNSQSEFIRIAILDYLVNNLDVKLIKKNEVSTIPIQEPIDNNKVRVPIGPGIYKEYKLKNPGVKSENPISE